MKDEVRVCVGYLGQRCIRLVSGVHLIAGRWWWYVCVRAWIDREAESGRSIGVIGNRRLVEA